MKREDILKMAHDVVEKRAVESDYIEYKRSADVKDGILKTACAYCNNLMNREIGLIFIGIDVVGMILLLLVTNNCKGSA